VNSMRKIVISESMDAQSVDALRARCRVVYDPTLVDDAPRLLAAARDCDALIVRNRTQVRGALLAVLGQARVIGRLGVGLDNIDVPACQARGMRVIAATGANAAAVAEYVLAAAFILLRGVWHSSAAVAAGQWPRAQLSGGREIGGKTLGLVGFGSIGQRTARLAQAVGMQVIAYDPAIAADAPLWQESGVARCALDALLAQADVVSLHLPLVAETENLFCETRLARMKPGAILVNAARGGICDEAAVARLLRGGHLGGAAFDVFADEPLGKDCVWANCPNALLTPHVAGITVESNTRVSTLIAREVLAALEAAA